MGKMETKPSKEEHLAKLQETIANIVESQARGGRVSRAAELAADVAAKAKALDRAVEDMGLFVQDVIETELSTERAEKKLKEKGYPEPKDHPLGIPNELSEETIERFHAATDIIVTAPVSDLRDQATFLISLCNKLMFERGLLEAALLRAREAQRRAVTEIISIGLKQGRRGSPHHPDLRR